MSKWNGMPIADNCEVVKLLDLKMSPAGVVKILGWSLSQISSKTDGIWTQFELNANPSRKWYRTGKVAGVEKTLSLSKTP